LSIYTSLGYLVSSGSYTLTSVVSFITNPSIISNNYKVLFSSASLELKFTASNLFTSVDITIPSSLNVSKSATTTCISYNTNMSISSCDLKIINNTTYLIFYGNGQGAIDLSWGYTTLPSSFAPTSTFLISTYLNDVDTQKSVDNFGLIMNVTA
jgi:hypothetical protein